MKFWLPSLERLRQSGVAAVVRFPWTIVATVVVTGSVLAGTFNSISSTTRDLSMRVFLAAVFFGLISVTVTLVVERLHLHKQKDVVLHLVSAVLGAGYFFLIPSKLDAVPGSVAVYLMLIMLLAALAILCVPFLNKPTEQRGVWYFQTALVAAAFFAFIYAGVLYLGISAILMSLHYLFEIVFNGKLYLQIWVVLAGFVAPLIFFARLPQVNDLEQKAVMPLKALVYLVQYVVLPLLAVYTLILYAYGIKIVSTWVWPKGNVVYLMMTYMVVGLLSLWFVGPLTAQEVAYKWIQKVARGFYALLLPLMVLYFVAIGMRINQYGVTENRYFVVAFGVVAVVAAVYMLLSKEKRFLFVPCALMVATLISLAGPVGATGMSKRSQVGRLEQLLIKDGILVDGKVKDEGVFKKISTDDSGEILNQLNYIRSMHDFSVIEPWFSSDAATKILDARDYDKAGVVLKILGVNEVYNYPNYNTERFSFRPTSGEAGQSPLMVGGYQYVIDNLSWYSSPLSSGDRFVWNSTLQGADYSVYAHDGVLSLRKDNKEMVQLNINQVAAALLTTAPQGSEIAVAQEELSVSGERFGIKARFYISNLYGHKEGDKIVLDEVRGTLLLGGL